MTRVAQRRAARWRRASEASSTDRACNTIRGRLWVGFGVLVALLLVAGVVGGARSPGCRRRSRESLADVQAESRLRAQLSADVAKTIEAGSRYLDTRDSSAQSGVPRSSAGPRTRCSAQMNDRPNQSAAEVAIIATIDSKLSSMEVEYALAHRLADLGRVDDARGRRRSAARRSIDELLSDIDRLGAAEGAEGRAPRVHSRPRPQRRADWLLALDRARARLRHHRRACSRCAASASRSTSRASRAPLERRRPRQPRRRATCRASSASSPRR